MKTESNIKVKNENFEFPKKPNFKRSKCNLLIEKIEKENRDKAQNENK